MLFLVELDLVVEDVVRLAHVRAKNDLGTLTDQILDGGQSAVDTVLIRDDAVFHRHVEIHAHQTAFTFDVYVFYCEFVHKYSFGAKRPI